MHDPAFPQLTTALHPQRMQTLLQQSAASAGAAGQERIVACSVDEVRYQPGKSCVLSYRLTLEGTGQASDRWVTAHLCHADAPLSANVADHGPALHVDGGLMRLCWFPDDRYLPHLPKLLNEATLQETLAMVLAAPGCNLGTRWSVESPEVVHYLPERSCVLRYTINGPCSTDSRYGKQVIYAKMYADIQQGASTWAAMRQLNGVWAYGAQALAFDADIGTLWQSQVPGCALEWSQLTGTQGADLLDNMAACIAALHTRPVTVTKTVTFAEIVRLLQKTVTMGSNTLPEYAQRIERIVRRLVLLQDRVQQGGAPCLLHRDLKLLNFIADGVQVRLIDMDTLAMGDALCDIASLVANFYLQACRNNTDMVIADKIVERFLYAYSSKSEKRVVTWRVNWHIAAALLYEVVRRSMRQLDASRLVQTQALVTVSERYCAQL